MLYKIRPGVVMVRICDVDILTATREVWNQCPAVRPLPRMWAFVLFLMEQGRNSEEALAGLAKVLKKPREELERQYESVFAKLYEEGFLVPAEEET